MALGLTTTNPDTGAVSTYIRLDSINLPSLTSGGSLRFGYYVDQAAADAGLMPDRSKEFVLTDDQNTTLRNEGLTILYNLAKATIPEFAGATDV